MKNATERQPTVFTKYSLKKWWVNDSNLLGWIYINKKGYCIAEPTNNLGLFELNDDRQRLNYTKLQIDEKYYIALIHCDFQEDSDSTTLGAAIDYLLYGCFEKLFSFNHIWNYDEIKNVVKEDQKKNGEKEYTGYYTIAENKEELYAGPYYEFFFYVGLNDDAIREFNNKKKGLIRKLKKDPYNAGKTARIFLEEKENGQIVEYVTDLERRGINE